MDAQKLTYFLAAAQTQNFRKAAELCHVAQPVLGRQIAVLEEELGVKLFLRGRRRVALTAAGETLVPHAQAILDRIKRSQQAMAALRAPVAGVLRLGCIEPLAATLLPPAFVTFHRQHPQARVIVTVRGTEELFGEVEHGALELGLFGLVGERSQPNPLLSVQELRRDRLALWVAAEHPLARAGHSVTVEQLLDEPLALLNERFAIRRLLGRLYAQRERELGPVLEIDNVVALKQLAQHGVATVLPRSLFTRADRRAGIVALPISDLSEEFTFALVYRRIGTLSPVAQAFIQAVKDGAGALGGEQ